MSTFTPTLVIGIGGTGKSVLWDVRSRLLARYGSFRDLPVIGFLALDTDLDLDRATVSGGLLRDALNFGAGEALHLTVAESQMSDIKQNLDTQYPYLSGWLEREALIHPRVVAGAGQIRQVGRLALYLNFRQVLAAITEALQAVISDESRRRTMDYLTGIGMQQVQARTKPLRVFVVGSLIGGTGSGMFIDLGYLLQKDTVRAMVAHAEPETTGIFVLPLSGESRSGVDTRASAYAALVELNHFSDPAESFETSYPDGTHFASSDPPYSFSFLVTTQSDKCALDGGRKVVQVIGQRIFLEATSEFAGNIRSNRDNIRKCMVEADGRFCNQYFCTFGLSTLEVPVRAIASSCGAMFLRELVSDLRHGRYAGKEGELKVDPSAVQSFLEEHHLNEAQLREALLVSPSGSLEKDVRSPFEAHATLASRRAVADLKTIESKLDVALTGRRGEGGVDGEFVRLLDENQRALSGACETYLTRLFSTITQQPDCRLVYARRFLDLLKGYFTSLKNTHAQKSASLAGGIEKGRNAVNRGRAELAGILADPLLALSLWQKSAYADAFTQRYGRDVIRLHQLRLESLLSQAMATHLEELLRVLEELSQRAEALDLYLEGLETTFGELSSQARQTYMPVNGKLIYAKGEEEMGPDGAVEQTYRTALGSAERRRRLLDGFYLDYVQPMLREPGGQINVFRLQKNAVDRSHMVETLWHEAAQEMQEWGKLEQVNVLDRFFEDANHDNEFKRVAELSSPFLQLNRQDNKYDDVPSKRQTMVGFFGAHQPAETSQSRFASLCELKIEDVRGNTDKKLVPFDDRAQVVFYQEYGAFPMRLWGHLGAMKPMYDQHRQRSVTPLHVYKRDYPFVPIVKPAPEETEQMQILFLVASAPGMNIFEESRENRRTQYGLDFMDRGRRRVVKLSGTVQQVARTLLDPVNEPVVRRLETEVTRRREELGDHEFARLLLEYRNALFDTETDAEARKRQQGLLDRYLEQDPGLVQAVDDLASQLPSPPPAGVPTRDLSLRSSDGQATPATAPAAPANTVAVDPGLDQAVAELAPQLPTPAPAGIPARDLPLLSSDGQATPATAFAAPAVTVAVATPAFCGGCGQPAAGTKFCPHCGSQLQA
ncbi:MAG: tubulin-like doman-containing protein [Armatimonadetes bacterium]|nr:tubulin-like doman-containing protein [Armatimonadota bacterium]